LRAARAALGPRSSNSHFDPSPIIAEEPGGAGFVRKRVFKRGGISVKRGRLEMETPPNFSPLRDRPHNLTKNGLGPAHIQTKPWRGSESPGDARLIQGFGDGRLGNFRPVDFRHWVQVISRRQRPATRHFHEKGMVARMIVVIADQ
jgi:hypothetical protein